MKMRRLAFAGIALASILAVASCGKKAGTTTTTGGSSGETTPTTTNSSETPTTTDEVVDSSKYTYNLSTTTLPTNWNPCSYQTSTDATILDYCSDGFYTFDYNDTLDGYAIVPAMATAEPEDVTASYVGQYGIEEGDSSYVWSIPLRTDLKWSDGTPITAEDFVTSAKLLLDPAAQNYRADTLYAGTMVVANAKNYLYQGQHAYSTPMVSENYGADEYVDPSTFTTNDEGNYVTDGKDMCVKMDDGSSWGASFDDYWSYLSEASQTALEAVADDDGVILINATSLPAVQNAIAELHGYADAAAYAAEDGDYAYQEWEEMAYYGEDYAEMDFSEVGVKADGNNLILILDKPLSGFYLLYNLTSSWLVNEKLYKQCETSSNGVYANTYGTSVSTFMSYGAYTLTEFQTDKYFRLEKNPYWYGYNDDANKGLYQTTDIVYSLVAEDSTRLELFNKGELDIYGLTADDMADYSNSEDLYYTEGASTFFIALNPNKSNLVTKQEAATTTEGKEINKTILTLKSFRQALSYAVDRKQFCLTCDPTGMAATAVFNSLIISDPENGTTYRSNEASKDVILDFWGLSDSVGSDKRYATKDEAIDSITGVDVTQAKAKFDEAYDEAIASGLMTADATIEICIGLPSSAGFYTKGYDFLVNCWTDAVKGTKLEGKLTFTKDDTIGNGFADRLRDNSVDVLFGVGWTGSALDPYSLVSAYTMPSYQYDPSIDYSKEEVSVHFDSITDVDGVVYKDITLSTDAYSWSVDALTGEEVEVDVVSYSDSTVETITINAGTDCDLTVRCAILNGVEACILQQYTLLPLDDEASASLKGKKVNYYTEDYIYGVGRGGVKYMTYNYNDEEWAEYVKSQGNILNYK